MIEQLDRNTIYWMPLSFMAANVGSIDCGPWRRHTKQPSPQLRNCSLDRCRIERTGQVRSRRPRSLRSGIYQGCSFAIGGDGCLRVPPSRPAVYGTYVGGHEDSGIQYIVFLSSCSIMPTEDLESFTLQRTIPFVHARANQRSEKSACRIRRSGRVFSRASCSRRT